MSVDSDGDGTLQGEEIRNFIDETIGGREFDEEKEIVWCRVVHLSYQYYGESGSRRTNYETIGTQLRPCSL